MQKVNGIINTMRDTFITNIPGAPIPHPLDPLSAGELSEAVRTVRSHFETQRTQQDFRLWFKGIQLIEPPKKVLSPYLDRLAQSAAGHAPALERPPRRLNVTVGVKSTAKAKWFEIEITLSAEGKGVVDTEFRVPTEHKVAADGEEMVAAEESLLKNPKFIKAIAELRLPEDATVVCDGWIYGADTTAETPRYIAFMCYLRFIDDPDSCHYSAPLPMVPTVRADDFVLEKIEYTPIFGGEDTRTVQDLTEPFPWHIFRRNEYKQAIREQDGLPSRADLKPYRVIQPEGASFSMEGRVLKWQKWSLHIGFNFREGLVISDVRYDGRKTFYRLSVSDMTVPYGDPRGPFHRKQAFDLGDCGAGLTANELQLGCDCLGEIMYLDFDHISASGSPTKLKGVVCIHEQDEGVGWKHTNFRTNNPSVTRARSLVVQSMITVANYEYIFAFKFDQAAGIHIETRATGIVSTHTIMPGESSPYGNVVSPGVLATNHQHIFSIRIDPAIDGDNNTVVQEDSVPMPFDKANPPANNLYGVGYVVEKTPITVAGWADADPAKNRVFKITNPNKLNPISGRPISYKLVPMPSQMMLAHPDSIAYQRAEFADHHVWVTTHKDKELYSGGHYTNQSSGSAEGIKSWVARKDSVENTDIVIWASFGLTHNPRVEDFPVMPCEVHELVLKPHDFFNASPSIDVPASTQNFNLSKLFAHAQTNGDGPVNGHMHGNAQLENEAKINGLGSSCCAKS